MSQGTTIFALSSAPGRAGVAVVRVSGPAASHVLDRMAPPRPPARMAVLRRLRHPRSREVLDQGLVLWFPAPGSFTGEDTVEFHVHGGRAVVQAVLSALSALPGCRLAEPGEFARRAFENGRIDLTQAEGLADLIDAETEAQRRLAQRQSEGALARLYDGWRDQLIEALADVEAAIDFSDEGDVGTLTYRRACATVGELHKAVTAHLDDGRRGEILRDGFQVMLAGPPNVGKSSLLNALARREAAIVSEEPGTTRDVIEVRLDLEGYPVVVSDTAGVREPTGAVEREGIRRTLERARRADLILWVSDGRAEPAPMPPELARGSARVIRVENKMDIRSELPSGEAIAVSALTGLGLSELLTSLVDAARNSIGALEQPALTTVRHRIELELRAEDLRRAANALGRLTGRIDSEQVLDRIFGRFCIGK
jgi:tRNA modification GTPase